MTETRWINILGSYRTTILWMLLNIPIWKKMHIISLQGSGEPGEKVQDDETKIQHLVPCTILVYNTVQNKTSSRLMNVILDNRGNATVING